jgi:NADPH-dependent 2,4-dienoyl-CoA reductase/sulfur reductase-like enzyme/Pyruvate/2-oxoacid:ferredoxin oxidoreductase delta subunit/bacterioferritin-associated ferredoxin
VSGRRTARRSGAGGRIDRHPILDPAGGGTVPFRFGGRTLRARPGEVISSALYAAGIRIFGRHHRDGKPLGIYCVNGQCSQCTVIADGRPVKACMTPVREGMRVEPVSGRPPLGEADVLPPAAAGIAETTVPVLVVGGGPAGVSAAIELGRAGIRVLLLDDKPALGGKLTLQTHTFFGSVADCYAGTRGIDIARILERDLAALPNVEVWLDASAVGIFRDRAVGVVRGGRYVVVRPEALLVAAGAREKALSFPGGDLPGVYGAGAFQTLVNRDLVRPTRRLFVLGGGNVGLIGAYHALQAGIEVVGLVEALARCGGYKVHEDKIKRLGVPVWTSHTVLRAEGGEELERIVVGRIDERFRPVPGTERTFEVDTLLVAVGLSPVDEILAKARLYGMQAWAAGDSEEIAEASAAIFSGRIAGRRIAESFGVPVRAPARWTRTAAVLRSKPGREIAFEPPKLDGRPVYPVIRCVQEIPCNPCTQVCPVGSIAIPDGTITSFPRFDGHCLGCGRCAGICPGLAIVLVEEDHDPKRRTAVVVVPFEFGDDRLPRSGKVVTTGMEGEVVGEGRIVGVRDRADQDRRRLVRVEVSWDDRLRVAAFRVQEPPAESPAAAAVEADDPVICLCERVRRSEVVAAIREGVRDLNELKAAVRLGMGGCGGKRCLEMVKRIFREEGVDLAGVTPGTWRPLDREVPLAVFAGVEDPADGSEGSR